jgi:hypothetical protein
MIRAKLVHDYAGHYQRMDVSFDVHPSQLSAGAARDGGRSAVPVTRPVPLETRDPTPEEAPNGR